MRLERECSSVLAVDIVIKRGSNYSRERRERRLCDYVACEVLLRVWGARDVGESAHYENQMQRIRSYSMRWGLFVGCAVPV